MKGTEKVTAIGRKMYRKRPSREIKFEVGHKFPSIDAFKVEIEEYVLKEGFRLERKKNEKKRFIRLCKHLGYL